MDPEEAARVFSLKTSQLAAAISEQHGNVQQVCELQAWVTSQADELKQLFCAQLDALVQQFNSQAEAAKAQITENISALESADMANYPNHFSAYDIEHVNQIDTEQILSHIGPSALHIATKQVVKFFNLKFPLYSFIYNSYTVADYDLQSKMMEGRTITGGEVLTRYHAWCFLQQPTILFTGGEFSGVATNKTWLIDSNEWTAAPSAPMTQRRQDHALVEFDGTVFAFGGDNGKQVYKTAERFVSGEWGQIAEMLNKRHQLGAARVGDDIYIAGAFSPKIEIYTPASDSYRELQTTELPNKKACTALCLLDNQLFIFNEDVYTLDIATQALEYKCRYGEDTFCSSSPMVYNNSIYLYNFQTLLCYNIKNNYMTKVTSLTV